MENYPKIIVFTPSFCDEVAGMQMSPLLFLIISVKAAVLKIRRDNMDYLGIISHISP